jgi:hypothetical protein
MKPSSWDKQLGLALPRESAASQSDQTNNPSKDEVRDEVGLDVSHHARISQRGGEKLFFLTSSFKGGLGKRGQGGIANPPRNRKGCEW